MASLQSPLLRELRKIVGEENTISDKEALLGYVSDFSPYPPVTPRIVVRPSTTEETGAVVRAARKEGFRVLTRGGGASFTGYLVPDLENTVVLETTRMNKVLEVDKEDMIITAQSGVILSRLEEEAGRKGLYLHTVTTPVRFSTLGGILSGVAGGGIPVRGASVGTDMNFVLGLEVVLASGEAIRTGAKGSNINSRSNFLRGGNGPDLTGLFIGDGGSFGVKTEASVQLFPGRRLSAAGCWSFQSIEDAWSAVSRMKTKDPVPYSQLKVRQAKTYDLYYVAEEASEERLSLDVALIEASCREGGGKKAPKELQEFARRYGEYMREDERMKSPKGMLAYFIPNSSFPKAYQEMGSFLGSRIERRKLDSLGVSIASSFRPSGRTGVYVNTMIMFEGGSAASRDEAKRLLGEAYAKVVSLGACPEPHQGSSSLDLRRGWSDEYLSFMKMLKRTLDPYSIFNPGVWDLPGEDPARGGREDRSASSKR